MSRCDYIINKGKINARVCGKKYKTPNEQGKCYAHFKCPHNRTPCMCIDCDGSHICEHKRKKSQCRECDGSEFCEHGNRKTRCDDCDGISLCEHKREKAKCIDCDGISICEHKKRRQHCKLCDFKGFLYHNVNCRLLEGYKYSNFIKKQKSTLFYLGCDIPTYIDYLNNLLAQQDIFTWENYGTHWQIDHIIPLYYNLDELTEEIFISRFHYTNTQPLSKFDNISKGSRFIG